MSTAPAAATINQNRILFLFFVWYLGLVVLHFLNQRPLWNDEACVLLSIQQLTPHQLFHQPLLADQGFPRFYLYLIQQFSSLFNHSLWSLRLLPFICMVSAFFVWMRLSLKTGGSRLKTINFVLAWAGSIPMIYYAAELKQYSMDVLACAVLVSVMVMRPKTYHGYYLWSFYLLFIPFSYPALFLSIILLFELIRLALARHILPQVLWLYTVLLIVALCYVYVFDFRVSARGLLETYWHDYFISLASLPDFFKTFGEGMNNLIGRWFVEQPKWTRGFARLMLGVGLAYLVYAGISHLRKSAAGAQSVLSVGGIILGILMILGSIRVFPFTVVRMSLFFAPILFWALAEFLEKLCRHCPVLYWPLQIMYWAGIAVFSAGIFKEIIGGDLGAESTIWGWH